MDNITPETVAVAFGICLDLALLLGVLMFLAYARRLFAKLSETKEPIQEDESQTMYGSLTLTASGPNFRELLEIVLNGENGIQLNIPKDSLKEFLGCPGLEKCLTASSELGPHCASQGNSESKPTGARSTNPTASGSEVKFEVPGGTEKLESFKKLEAKLGKSDVRE